LHGGLTVQVCSTHQAVNELLDLSIFFIDKSSISGQCIIMRHEMLNKQKRTSAKPMQLRRFFTYRIAALNRKLIKEGERYFAARVGLNGAEWRIVGVLGCDGELNASVLAERSLLDPGQSTRVTSALSERGYLHVRSDPDDARRSLVRLTSKGKALFDRAVPHAIARHQNLIGVLTETEIEALDRILEKLMSGSLAEEKAA
jgi:DNA-binding MarR family transcriptional regulator